MPAEKAAKPIIKRAPIRLRADTRADKRPPSTDIQPVATEHVRRYIRQIRLAPREQIGPRLAEHVLDALGQEQGEHEAEAQAHEAGVAFPELGFPEVRC